MNIVFQQIQMYLWYNTLIQICATVCGRIKGASVPIYAIWHCPLGLPSVNMRIVAHRAPLISHALNEILALGIPRYTSGQLVRIAPFLRKLHSWKINNREIQKNDTKVSVHTVSLRISTCKNVSRVYFTKMISIVQFVA